MANKQDLPESMKAEKIKRLLGAPTFAMVATDKTRREEFIRLMLEVAAKTVGVQLPELPISEMITVRRGSEEIDPQMTGTQAQRAKEGGFEDVPFQEGSIEAISETQIPSGQEAIVIAEAAETTTQSTGQQQLVAQALPDRSRILHALLILQREGMPEVAFHLKYLDDEIDKNAVASLISALDSFGGIDAEGGKDSETTDALETIEHEGNLVMIEKSKHFVMALIVTNDSDEDVQRSILTSLLVNIEQKYQDVWDSWDGDVSIFETSVFDVLAKLPMRPISFDYIVRSREAGKPLPFENRDVGAAVVEVKSAVENNETIGGLVRSLDLPRETVLGCLQIMNQFGWIDFKVEIGPESHLKKMGDVDEETQKAYGQVVVQFVDLCDGTLPMQDVVRKLNVSLPAMKFVATKLVLDGVLEVVA
ncbi:MAG: hypothetical protein ACXAB5_08355 [Candidatus Thorarchaeota archaeon]